MLVKSAVYLVMTMYILVYSLSYCTEVVASTCSCEKGGVWGFIPRGKESFLHILITSNESFCCYCARQRRFESFVI